MTDDFLNKIIDTLNECVGQLHSDLTEFDNISLYSELNQDLKFYLETHSKEIRETMIKVHDLLYKLKEDKFAKNAN